MPIDPSIKEAVEDIGKELVASGVLTPEERGQVIKWTAAMGVAAVQGKGEEVANYRVALSAMIGVAELRAAAASEKALLRMASLGLSILTKAVVGI